MLNFEQKNNNRRKHSITTPAKAYTALRSIASFTRKTAIYLSKMSPHGLPLNIEAICDEISALPDARNYREFLFANTLRQILFRLKPVKTGTIFDQFSTQEVFMKDENTSIISPSEFKEIIKGKVAQKPFTNWLIQKRIILRPTSNSLHIVCKNPNTNKSSRFYLINLTRVKKVLEG